MWHIGHAMKCWNHLVVYTQKSCYKALGTFTFPNTIPKKFPDSSAGEESICNVGDPGPIPGLGRSPEGIGFPLQYSWAFLVAQMVKNLPAMQETWIWSLGWEDPLKKGMATHSNIVAHWQRSLVGYSPWDCTESDTTEWLSTVMLISLLGMIWLLKLNFIWMNSSKGNILFMQ